MSFDGGIRTLLLIGRARKAELIDIQDCAELPGRKAFRGDGALRLEPVPGALARFTPAFDDGTSRRAVTGEEDLLEALAVGGAAFFGKLGELTQEFYDQEIEKLTGRSVSGHTGPSA